MRSSTFSLLGISLPICSFGDPLQPRGSLWGRQSQQYVGCSVGARVGCALQQASQDLHEDFSKWTWWDNFASLIENDSLRSDFGAAHGHVSSLQVRLISGRSKWCQHRSRGRKTERESRHWVIESLVPFITELSFIPTYTGPWAS